MSLHTPAPAVTAAPENPPVAPPPPHRVPASAWGLLVLLTTIWSTSFILMKKGLVVFSAVELGATRVTVAAQILLPFALRHVRQVEHSRFKWLLLSGVIGTLLPAFLFAYAETKMASGLAGVLNALTVAFTLLMGALFFGQQITGLRLAGIGVGLLGTVVLIAVGGSGGTATPTGEGNAWYGLYIVLATMGYGISINMIKQHFHGIPAVAVTALLLMLIGGPALLYLLLGTEFLYKLQHIPGAWTAFGYIALLATMSTAVAMILFNKLIQQSTALFASSNTYLVPVMALAWGVLDGEVINAWHLLGMGIILLSVFIINRAK